MNSGREQSFIYKESSRLNDNSQMRLCGNKTNNTTPQKSPNSGRININNIGVLQLKMISQHNLIKEYEAWVNILLSIINDKTGKYYSDIGTPIQKNLQMIEKYKMENFQLKQKTIEESIKNKKKEIELMELKETQKCIKADLNKCSMNQVIFEKKQLMNNIQLIADELDKQSEKYKKLHETLSKPEYSSYSKAIKEYTVVKEENILLHDISKFQNKKGTVLKSNEKTKDTTIKYNTITPGEIEEKSHRENESRSIGYKLFSCG